MSRNAPLRIEFAAEDAEADGVQLCGGPQANAFLRCDMPWPCALQNHFHPSLITLHPSRNPMQWKSIRAESTQRIGEPLAHGICHLITFALAFTQQQDIARADSVWEIDL